MEEQDQTTPIVVSVFIRLCWTTTCAYKGINDDMVIKKKSGGQAPGRNKEKGKKRGIGGEGKKKCLHDSKGRGEDKKGGVREMSNLTKQKECVLLVYAVFLVAFIR